MSLRYSVQQFMVDFHALWKDWPTLVTEYNVREMDALIRGYFTEHYGADAQTVADLHMKTMDAIGEYIDERRPEFSKAVECIPDNIATAIFFLVNEGRIPHPTPEQVELVVNLRARSV
jgi:hypothetical protein